MARQIGKLTALVVNKLKDKGVYPDGGNLYLQITGTGSKSWILRYMMNGKARTMGLGAFHAVSLAEARDKATDCRRLIAAGIDPIQAQHDKRQKEKAAAARGMTFKQCAEAYIEAHKPSWNNEKHIWQWENTMERFAYPVFGNLPVQDIDVGLVMKVIEPLWKEKTETASRVRGRIESILDWASVRGYRDGDNPARWRGKLESLLPARAKVQKVQHHPALPYKDMADFMGKLSMQEGLAAKALELTILTAVRTTETINAQWSEFDLKAKIWTIPAARMKMKKEHRVPLSEPALKTLKELHKLKTSDYVFPSNKDKPLSNMAMLALLRRMGHDNITVHGFRSTFRDWIAEKTDYPHEVAESALAHIVGNRVEAAYRRGDLFDKRRDLMNDWAMYATSKSKAKAGKKKGKKA